ncbi:MAG: hypothetical protein EU539_05870 [Promethearchaeota archaeon]|nr:MAG: hypothetical protein EU539_05870 [Candidatus Lokiarchaeota archaeon]
MVSKELSDILGIFRERFSDEIFNAKMHKLVYLNLLKNKEEKFEEFKDLIRNKWLKFKSKNERRTIEKTYAPFLYSNFHELFQQYLQDFFAFNADALELVIKEQISKKTLLIEYNYHLAPEEIKEYNELSKKIKGNLYGLLFFTGYLFFLVGMIGRLIRETIKEDLHITLDCAVIKEDNGNKYVNFLILVRNVRKEIFDNYFYMTSFYFLKQFKGIPDDYYEKLLRGREKLYQLALEQYPSTKERLGCLLFYFYRKCKLLENFCPLLDFLNFVCSRVEDSIYSKIDIINKEFLANFDYPVEKKNSLIRIFDFLDKISTLYSTFQANNLPSQKSQFNLFLLIMKYYFGSGSLETLEVGNILLLPDKFKKTLNQHNKSTKNGAIGSNTIKDISKLINYLSVLSNLDDIDLFFKKIFNKRISQLNYRFFRSFLKSFNTRFSNLIDEENKKLSENPKNEPFTFNIIVDHVSRMLYVLVDKIFLRENLKDASKNFIDPRGRYVGKNIALRVLELFIFQEINFSDDIWPEYLLSIYRDKLNEEIKNYVNIPEKYFYSDKDLTKFLTMYNLQTFSTAQFFEEWIINEIIIPLNNFIQNIRGAIKNKSNSKEIYKTINEYLMKDLRPQDKKISKELKFACDRIAQFWIVDK